MRGGKSEPERGEGESKALPTPRGAEQCRDGRRTWSRGATRKGHRTKRWPSQTREGSDPDEERGVRAAGQSPAQPAQRRHGFHHPPGAPPPFGPSRPAGLSARGGDALQCIPESLATQCHASPRAATAVTGCHWLQWGRPGPVRPSVPLPRGSALRLHQERNSMRLLAALRGVAWRRVAQRGARLGGRDGRGGQGERERGEGPRAPPRRATS